MNQIGKERPSGSLTKASPRAEENLHDQSISIFDKVNSISVRRAVLVKEIEESQEKRKSS